MKNSNLKQLALKGGNMVLKEQLIARGIECCEVVNCNQLMILTNLTELKNIIKECPICKELRCEYYVENNSTYASVIID